MINSYKDRQLNTGDRVSTYRNLHNDQFSIRLIKGGLVVAHGNNFIIKNAIPYVSESGRQRVLDKKQKNVHAYIKGIYAGLADEDTENGIYAEVYYNPYELDQFVIKETMKPLGEYDVDFLFKNGKCYLIH